MSGLLKPLDEIFRMSNDDYAEYLKSILNDDDGFWQLDELDDNLVGIVGEQPDQVERICRINARADSRCLC